MQLATSMQETASQVGERVRMYPDVEMKWIAVVSPIAASSLNQDRSEVQTDRTDRPGLLPTRTLLVESGFKVDSYLYLVVSTCFNPFALLLALSMDTPQSIKEPSPHSGHSCTFATQWTCRGRWQSLDRRAWNLGQSGNNMDTVLHIHIYICYIYICYCICLGCWCCWDWT